MSDDEAEFITADENFGYVRFFFTRKSRSTLVKWVEKYITGPLFQHRKRNDVDDHFSGLERKKNAARTDAL